jgi:MerR family transcriptional regulator, heat shock protein HspR
VVEQQPCYVISIAARMVSVHPQTLRYYERLGLVVPSRSLGNIRLYSNRDVERLQLIHRLVNDLGVNLAGVEVILNLTERIASIEQESQALRQQLEEEILRLRSSLGLRSLLGNDDGEE